MADEGKGILVVVGGVFGVIALVILVVIPMSFSYLEYYQFGFARQKSTGTVSTDKVYGSGRQFIGPDFEFKVFQADAHFVSLDVSVFTSDKLEVRLVVNFQYFLRKEDLPLLHKQFDVYYKDVMKSSAVDALKGATPQFTTRQMIENRKQVEDALYKAVFERLGGKCCRKDCTSFTRACVTGCEAYEKCSESKKGLFADVKYFQLGRVSIPDDVGNRYLQALKLKEETEREKLLQEAQVIRKNTTAMVQRLKNDAKEISANATAHAKRLTTVSQANYTAIIETARSEGLKYVFDKLRVTDQKYKDSFDYLRTIRGLDNIHLTVDFQQRIAGNLK